MKIKFLILLIFTITFIGCEKNNDVDAERQSYDINEKANKIRKDIHDMYENGKLNIQNEENNNNDNNVTNQDDNNNSNENADKSDISIYIPQEKIENEKANSVPEEPIVNIAPSSLLDSFTTNILTTDSNRYNNIRIVSDRLNNHILNPRRSFFL